MNGLAYDLAVVRVLWRRDLLRFLRQPARLLGALGQPIIFWGVMGSGMARSFRLPETTAALSYLEFFYPGVVLMVALFASIFASVSLIEDRHVGFLQAVLAGPGSRWALVVGKCLGSCSVALVQIGALLLLAPLAGFELARVAWGPLVSLLVLSCLGLSALGFAVAWWLDQVQAYHAVQMTLLMPLWIVSGSVFPLGGEAEGLWGWLAQVNPLAYAVAGVRQALYGGQAPHGTVLAQQNALAAGGVLVAFCAMALACGILACRRR